LLKEEEKDQTTTTTAQEQCQKIHDFAFNVLTYDKRSKREQLRIKLEFEDLYNDLSNWMAVVSEMKKIVASSSSSSSTTNEMHKKKEEKNNKKNKKDKNKEEVTNTK
jgi:hypothetical protein